MRSLLTVVSRRWIVASFNFISLFTQLFHFCCPFAVLYVLYFVCMFVLFSVSAHPCPIIYLSIFTLFVSACVCVVYVIVYKCACLTVSKV